MLARPDPFPLKPAFVADLLLPATEATSALLRVVAADLSFIRGMGASEMAASWHCSRNFLKSLSPIFLPEDFCSSLIASFALRFFSGVVATYAVAGFAATLALPIAVGALY